LAKKKYIKIGNVLRDLLLAKNIRAQQIILFGSQVEEKESPNSDIDLIVVSKDFRNLDIFEKIQRVNGVHKGLVKKVRKPFDIMYYSDIEWERRDSIIINEAWKKGTNIYTEN
jgi:uncharacterized protein